MEREINAGYSITDRLSVGESEFVIGQCEEAPSQFVTWKCRKGSRDYYWGHYLSDRLSAVEDLCRRTLEEIERIREIRLNEKTDIPTKPKRRSELER